MDVGRSHLGIAEEIPHIQDGWLIDMDQAGSQQLPLWTESSTSLKYTQATILFFCFLSQGLNLWSTLALNSQRSTSLCPSNIGMKGVCHPAWLTFIFLRKGFTLWVRLFRIQLCSPGCPQAHNHLLLQPRECWVYSVPTHMAL